MPHVAVNGADFYSTLEGSGSSLVIIGGYTANHNFCPEFIDKMRKNFLF